MLAAVPSDEPFHDRLRNLMARCGPEATQAWLSDRSGVDRSLISRIATGERLPTFDTLQCLAPVLGVTLADLVKGTDAEPRLADGADYIRRSDYQEVVKSFIELEGKTRELEAQVRSLKESLAREEEGRRKADRAASEAEAVAKRDAQRLGDLQTRFDAQAGELSRYREALARAVAEFTALRMQLGKLQAELGKARDSSKVAAVLGGVAAVTGVATLAHFLGEESSNARAPRRARAHSPKRKL